MPQTLEEYLFRAWEVAVMMVFVVVLVGAGVITYYIWRSMT
jgi:hypothetical protein